MVRALVSGLSGHVGQELALQLLASGVEVHGITRGSSVFERISPCDVRVHKIDGRTETLTRIFEEVKPDVVLHLAALARRQHLSRDVIPFVEANVLLGTQLLEASKLVGCRRFVTAGSYLQHDELGHFRAFNLYASTKQAFEDILAYYVDAFGFSVVVLTLCNIYGEHDPRPTLLRDIATATALKPLQLHSEDAWVDLVHVEDAARAFIHVMTQMGNDTIRPASLNKYSVSSGRDMTAGELVKLVERMNRQNITVQTGTRRFPVPRVKPWRGSELPGWRPQVTLEAGITRILGARGDERRTN